VLEELSQAAKIHILGGGRTLISEHGLEKAGQLLKEHLDRFHQGHPLEAGMGREPLLKESRLPADVLEAAAARLVSQGVVADEHRLLRGSDFKVPLSPEQMALARRLEELYLERLFSAPSLREAATALEADEKDAAELGRLLEQQGKLVRLGEKVILHRKGVEEARAVVLRHLVEHGTIRAAELRNLLDSSRKYAIALLDHFDRTGLLLRRENVHYLRPGANTNRRL